MQYLTQIWWLSMMSWPMFRMCWRWIWRRRRMCTKLKSPPPPYGRGLIGKASQFSETMSEKNCLIFRISQLTWVDLHSNILKLWENGEQFWNEGFCMLSPGALVRWCMNPASLNYTLRKKKCNFPTFLRGEFSFWVLQENCEQFLNRFFTHCYQEHWQNEIHYKLHLSTLFPKRNATFHGAFLLKKSVTFSQCSFRPLAWTEMAECN